MIFTRELVVMADVQKTHETCQVTTTEWVNVLISAKCFSINSTTSIFTDGFLFDNILEEHIINAVKSTTCQVQPWMLQQL